MIFAEYYYIFNDNGNNAADENGDNKNVDDYYPYHNESGDIKTSEMEYYTKTLDYTGGNDNDASWIKNRNDVIDM